MNKKGFTTIELITSFTLASIIMIILFNIILIMKDNLSRVSAMTNTLVEKDNLSYNINKRLKDKELASLTMCSEGDKCYLFTYSDSTSDKLVYSITDKTITFNNYTFEITDDMNVEAPTITEHYDTMSSTTFNGYFILNIPITVDGKDYSIKVNKHFNTDSVMVELGSYYYDNERNRYTPVEYLESTGTQYINTLYYPDENTNAKYKVKLLTIKYYGPHLLSSKNYYFPFIRTYGNEILSSRNKSELIIRNFIKNSENIYEFEAWNNNKIIINGQEFEASSYNVGRDTVPLYLLTYGGDPTNEAYLSNIRLYYCKIYDSDNLVRDFVPVIDSTSRPCLFDKVEKKCYYNQGTGEFLYG